MALSEIDKAFFGIEDSGTLTETTDTTTADNNTETTTTETTTTDEPVIVDTAPVIEEPAKPAPAPYEPPYKGKKYIEVADEAALYEKLDKKYGHTKISADAKALAFIREQNPELDDEEIAFTAATKYGIGLDPIPDEELTDEQKVALRHQGIDRKKLISQADAFFKAQAEQVALEETDPLSLDEGYKTYMEQSVAQKVEAENRQNHINEINTNIEKTAKIISEIVENIEIDIDDRKFAVPVSFKMDAKKQEQLIDFAKRYTPTEAEAAVFGDPKSGKFDYEGYMKSLIPMVFGKELSKASARQALSQDRDNFISKELKNSSLKDDLRHGGTTEKPFDLVDAWKFG